MSDVISGVRQIIQDLVAPDLKAIQAKLDSQGKQMEMMHDVTMKVLDAFRAEMRSEFAALKAQNQVLRGSEAEGPAVAFLSVIPEGSLLWRFWPCSRSSTAAPQPRSSR